MKEHNLIKPYRAVVRFCSNIQRECGILLMKISDVRTVSNKDGYQVDVLIDGEWVKALSGTHSGRAVTIMVDRRTLYCRRYNQPGTTL